MLTIGAALYPAVTAADLLRSHYQLEAEIIDARSLVPFDYAPVLESVEKTGRIVLVADACQRGSLRQHRLPEHQRNGLRQTRRPAARHRCPQLITLPTRWKKNFSPSPNGSSTRSMNGSCRTPGHRPIFTLTVPKRSGWKGLANDRRRREPMNHVPFIPKEMRALVLDGTGF